MQKHLIGKQILELEINSSKDAYAIQQKMSQLVQKELSPALNKLFDTLVDKNTMILLDSIEVDIGDINLENGDFNKIIDKIVLLLKETIEDKLKNIDSKKNIKKPFNRKQIQKFLNGDRNEFLNKKTSEVEQKYTNGSLYDKETNHIERRLPKEAINQPLRRYYFEAWLHWLGKGVLPSYVIPPENDWITSVLETLGLDIDAVTILEKKLKKSSVASQRLILQHSSQDLKSIVELYTGFSQASLLKVFDEIEQIFVRHKSIVQDSLLISFRELEIKIWKEIFEIVIFKRQKINTISIVKETINQLVLENVINGIQLQKIVKEEVQKKKSKDYATLIEIFDKDTIYEEVEDGAAIKDEIENRKDSLKEETVEEDIISNEELVSPQYFKNAGMVLLHPFLSHFFKKLNLIEGKDFINHVTRSKAVLLLHFLATGEEQPKEYDMVLSKFLCEMPTNIPLDHTLIITEKEKEESDALLQAVVEHWGALGGTSPDGLREGFLSREGKLEREQTGWKLYIEQKTLDILLDKLPWNISIIKLPWMKEMLKVEWR
ncbi:contractile injection system tape measure protein [Aquimarina sp. MMG016]|uniref:contractile injection system tape measure protein n=1 Tax=Aquimarina sp. MMG016 TaxID=2822690 RepID=UPI001B39E8D5|nr:contractile injection system tape measure protein [Aquimarina sp. MMG016]MBQ4818576.1 hypothetical protein [Aquimarina sp. MMG016]